MKIMNRFGGNEPFDKYRILELLNKLNDELRRIDVKGDLYLVDGAVMCLAYDSRLSTHDLDGVFEPKSQIYECSKIVARDEGIEIDWLKDAVKGFLGNSQDFNPYLEFTNLTVKIASAEYLLAMKVQSSRLDNNNEVSDIKFLLSLLKIRSVSEVEEIVGHYYDLKLIKPKCWYLVEELLEDV